jgi:hypothetical protein
MSGLLWDHAAQRAGEGPRSAPLDRLVKTFFAMAYLGQSCTLWPPELHGTSWKFGKDAIECGFIPVLPQSNGDIAD